MRQESSGATGIQFNLQPDYTALGATFTDNKKAVDDIVAGLTAALNVSSCGIILLHKMLLLTALRRKTESISQNAAVAANDAAKAAVQKALTSYSAFDELLKPTTDNNIPKVRF